MDPISLSHAAPQPVPSYSIDQRPAADAAAISKDPNPHIAMPVASNQPSPVQVPATSQIAAVSQSNLTASVEALGGKNPQAPQAERTLKPYGVTMLPESAQSGKATPAAPAQDASQDTSDLPPDDT